jgi:hypothetical protein
MSGCAMSARFPSRSVYAMFISTKHVFGLRLSWRSPAKVAALLTVLAAFADTIVAMIDRPEYATKITTGRMFEFRVGFIASAHRRT